MSFCLLGKLAFCVVAINLPHWFLF